MPATLVLYPSDPSSRLGPWLAIDVDDVPAFLGDSLSQVFVRNEFLEPHLSIYLSTIRPLLDTLPPPREHRGKDVDLGFIAERQVLLQSVWDRFLRPLVHDSAELLQSNGDDFESRLDALYDWCEHAGPGAAPSSLGLALQVRGALVRKTEIWSAAWQAWVNEVRDPLPWWSVVEAPYVQQETSHTISNWISKTSSHVGLPSLREDSVRDASRRPSSVSGTSFVSGSSVSINSSSASAYDFDLDAVSPISNPPSYKSGWAKGARRGSATPPPPSYSPPLDASVAVTSSRHA